MARSMVRPLGKLLGIWRGVCTDSKGLLEKYYSARSSLGLYNSVIVTGSYSTDQPYAQEELHSAISRAVLGVIACHDILRCCIQGDDESKPVFVLSDDLDITAMISLRTITKDQSVIQHLEELHDQAWRQQNETPPWRIGLLWPDQSRPSGIAVTKVDIAFVFHHALADGLSGAAFHSCLLQKLNELSFCSNAVAKSPSPDKLSVVAPVEKLISFHNSLLFLLREVLQEYGPSWLFGRQTQYYSGADCGVSATCPYTTHLRLLEIDAEEVQSLLRQCKIHSVTMTSLITASLVISLAINLPSARSLVGSTPYTMRGVSGTGFQDLCNQTSGFDTTYDSTDLDDIRQYSTSDMSLLTNTLWSIAARHTSQLKSTQSAIHKDNPVGLLPYVSDFHTFFTKKLHRKREKSFEVSNLGLVPFSPSSRLAAPDPTTDHTPTSHRPSTGDRRWRIEKAVFSQGAAVVGPALALSCASVRDGPMTITMSWQENVVEEGIVEKVVDRLAKTLRTVAGEIKDGEGDPAY